MEPLVKVYRKIPLLEIQVPYMHYFVTKYFPFPSRLSSKLDEMCQPSI